jgi:putative flippase GtrA
MVDRPLLTQMLRYGTVGLANTAVGLAVIAGVELGLKAPGVVANACGYLAGILVGFMLNRAFVFRSLERVSRSGPRYIVSFGIAYLANLAVLTGLRAALPLTDLVRIGSQVCAMGVYTVLLFLLSRYWVFAGSSTR